MERLDRWQRRDTHRRFGDNAHPPLGTEHHLAQIGPSGGGREDWQIERADRRDHLPPGEPLFDASVAKRLRATGACGDPAAERRILERLWEMPQRIAARPQMRLQVWPAHARLEA